MYEFAEFFHYGVIGLIVGINSVGVGIGEGLTGKTAIEAINRQPHARNDITRATILGMALIETAAIIGLFIGIMLLLGTGNTVISFHQNLAALGIAFAICFSGLTLGFVSAWPAQEACNAIARQPFFSQRIISFMIMTQALIQTPIISGLIVALFIRNQAAIATTMSDSLRLIGSGISVGLGSVGPAIGLAIFARAAVRGLGINPKAYNKLLSFTLISEAIIETPVIFSLVIAITLLFIVPTAQTENVLHGIAFLAAGLCTGMGTLGPGISSGKTAASACTQIAHNPDIHSVISRVSMFAQGLIETCAIYAVLISFLLILFR